MIKVINEERKTIEKEKLEISPDMK